MTEERFHTNNFNLIRLLAALQVAHYHLVSIYAESITVTHAFIVKFLGLFPGVPIFFFISGFLISRSWERSESAKSYFVKRAARIEPALIASIVFALVLTWASGYFSNNPDVSWLKIIEVILAKATILQFYNPEFLRDYGDGVLNGSLWTITVEIQFYLLLPIIYLAFFKKGSTLIALALIGIFALINGVYDFLHDDFSKNITFKLFHVSFAPWFFMFLTGVLFQKKFNFFYKALSGKFIFLLPFYILISFIAKPLHADYGNSLNPIVFAILSCLIFSAAYSPVRISDKLLGGTDISYGTYLYHMPIINFFIYLNFPKDYLTSAFIFILIIGTSTASWFFIEKPCLNFAKKLNVN
ncbi:acyltransferase [Cellvibrio sp. NN19]|uniref:acyltransferase family protein n=1 Tax=Cellvibrio chitinivorans TaxID=3102792 RepID=UPI002B4014EB|nr:acyltransferase [Cellvibrio sp. NN19]